MCRSTVHVFRLISLALACLWWAAGCGENYVPLYDRPCDTDAECNDGQFCNGVETCDVANSRCLPGTPPDVNDGLDCTFDTCDEHNDVALHLPDDDLCDDGVFCNGVEQCDRVAGCLAGPPVDVDDGIACTQDACDENSDTIVHTPNDAMCDDGRFCNGTETCSVGFGCTVGAPAAVDDGIDCTFDACDEALDVAVHLPVDSMCDDLDACTIDTCKVGSGCQSALDPLGDATCFACDVAQYSNGNFDLVDGVRPTSGFLNNGIIDDFRFFPGNSEFCEVRVSMFRTDGSLQHRQLRVRIYDLGAGGIPGLGGFTTTQPFYDETFYVSNGTLVITDTGQDAFGFSAFNYAARTSPVDLGAGTFGLHISFPDESSNVAYWMTAPATGGTTNAHTWGANVLSPSDTGFEKLAFSFIGQSGAPVPLGPDEPTSSDARETAGERVISTPRARGISADVRTVRDDHANHRTR